MGTPGMNMEAGSAIEPLHEEIIAGPYRRYHRETAGILEHAERTLDTLETYTGDVNELFGRWRASEVLTFDEKTAMDWVCLERMRGAETSAIRERIEVMKKATSEV